MKNCRCYFLSPLFLAASLLLLMPAQPVHAGLAVSPLKQEISLRPGEPGKVVINILNRVHDAADVSVSANLSIVDFAVHTSGGLEFQNPGTQKNSASKWITLPDKQVTLEPGKAVALELTVTPPIQTPPGEYYSAVIVSLVSRARTNKGVQIQYEIASGVFVTVLGQSFPKQAKITSMAVQWPAPPATQPAGAKPPELEPAKVVVVLHNTGAARFTATGKMRILGANGRVVMTAVLTSTRPCVFGGDSRTFTAPLTKALPPGAYTVKVDLDYESTWTKAYQTLALELTPDQSALLARLKDSQGTTAVGVVISPLKFMPAISAGAARSLGLSLKSCSDVPVRCMLSVASTGNTDIENWISLGATDLSLAPSAHKSIEIKITVPSDAKTDTYPATLTVESWPEGSEVRRTEIPLEIQVRGGRN